jgi:hypothetical protein
MGSGQMQDMEDLNVIPTIILKLTHVTAAERILIVTALAAMIVHSMGNTQTLPDMTADRNNVTRATLNQDMMTDHSDKSKEATPREVVQTHTRDTNRRLAKLETTPSTLSAPVTWTKALESLSYAGMAILKMRLTLSFPRNCTFTASFSSSMIVSSSAVQPI